MNQTQTQAQTQGKSAKSQQLQQLAERLAKLPDAKKQQFRQALQAKGIDPWKLPIVAATPDAQGGFPLSFAQQRLWFVEQAETGNALYNLLFGLRFKGQLDLSAVEQSMNSICQRHSILRTTYHSNDLGEASQRVQAFAPWQAQVDTLPLADGQEAKSPAQSSDEAAISQQEQAIANWVQQQAKQPFDLQTGPIFRFNLLKLSDSETIALFVVHHIAFDFLSVELLVREFVIQYQQAVLAKTQSSRLALPELPIQYADFAAWQTQWAQSPDWHKQKDYWLAQLADAPPRLDLPSDYLRQGQRRGIGQRLGIELPLALSDTLRSGAQEQGVTLYMLMLSIFNLLLNRYSQQQDICIGTSIANRGRPETESLLGFFVNVLVMRNQLDPEMDFATFLQQVNATAAGAYAHQDLPFDQLVDLLGVPRDASSTPLFQVLFVLTMGDDSHSQSLPGLEVSAFHQDQGIARYELTLRISDNGAGSALACQFEFDCDLYRQDSIEAMLQQYQTLCDIAVEALTQPVPAMTLKDFSRGTDMPESSAPMLTPALTQADLPVAGIHQLFEQQAQANPERLALVAGTPDKDLVQLSYAQLNQQANRLAHYLRQRGVGKESLVGLYMERSSALLVGILAVLKAGGAYIPLDSKWPINRINQILSEAEAHSVLTESQWQTNLQGLAGREAIDIDQLPEQAGYLHLSEANPDTITSGDCAAYVIYTSGSTGAPKGVVVEHQNILSYSLAVAQRLAADGNPRSLAGLRFAHISTIAADLGNTTLYGALCFGGTLHLIDNDTAFDPDAVAQYMHQQNIDVLKIVPSHLQGLLAAAQPRDILPKQLLIVGGEACSQTLLQRARNLAPNMRIINHYGPSETTVGALTHELDIAVNQESIPAPVARIPLGQPLANSLAFVLDPYGNPCPVGVSGELFLAGGGVARGYLNRGDLTKERFSHGYCPLPGQPYCCYRTGDRVRRLANGDLEFIGRMDKQVKVRGYRVELGDIEAGLKQVPDIDDALVLVSQGEVSEQLMAFVVLKEQAKPEAMVEAAADDSQQAKALQQYLSEQLSQTLPEYMVPQRFVQLDEMPLTPNGKVDTQALQRLGQQLQRGASQADGPQEKRGPRNDKETRLLAVIKEVLRREDIGIDDNFFELGGDSILSLQVIARAKRSGLKLNPKQFIEQSSLLGLAEVASEVVVKDKKATGLNRRDVPLTPIQQWFWQTEHPEPDYWNQSMVFQTETPVNASALRHAVAAVVERHPQLRAEFAFQFGKRKQRIVPWQASTVDQYFHQVDWLQGGKNSSVEGFAELVDQWQASLSLQAKEQAGQLFKVVYFAGSEQVPDRLLLVAHHLIIDGVSWRVLMEDLMLAYQQACDYWQSSQSNNPSEEREQGIDWSLCPLQLPAATASFQEWGLALQEAVKQDNPQWLEISKAYWQNMAPRFEHAQQLGQLATIAAAQQNEADAMLANVKHHYLELPKALTQALLTQAPKAYKTRINDLLLTALVMAVTHVAEQKEQTQPTQARSLNSLYLELEGHGRELMGDMDIDVSRTVGWFTSRFPVLLDMHDDLATGIKGIKEQLRQLPEQGMSYGVLHYLHALPALPKPALSFNYLGQMAGDNQYPSFSGVPGLEQVNDRHPNSKVTHLLSVNAMVADERLQIRWSHVPGSLAIDVEALANAYNQALQQIIQHCGNRAQGVTPSDFPLAQLPQDQLDSLVRESGVPVADIADIYPMTAMQEGLMFHTLLKPNSGIYVMQYCYELQGEFNHEAFVEAGRLVVAQHPILRTSFLRQEERSMQMVHHQVQSPVRVLDWRHLSPEQQQQDLQHWLQQKLRESFDLSQPTQLAITLIRTGEDRYQLVRSFHHILMDAWCFSLLMNDFMRAYQAVCEQQVPQLSQPRAYRDYIQWLQTQDMNQAKAFWQQWLQGFSAPTSLGIGCDTQAQGVKDHVTYLTQSQTQTLQEVAQGLHTTVNTLVQAAWGLLLSRYSGENEIVFGVTVAGRPTEMEGAQGILGLFINSLPLALRLDPNAAISDYLQQVLQANLAMREYEFAPLVDIHQWSDFPAGVELFDSLFVFENAPLELDEDTAAPSFELQSASNRTHTNYPITVVVYPKSTLGLQLTYDRSKFADADVARMLENFEHTLVTMAEVLRQELQSKADPAKSDTAIALTRLADINIVPLAMQRKLLVDWNKTTTDYPKQQCWPSLFVQQAQTSPDAIAAGCDGMTLSYRELEEKSADLATQILAAGVEANDVVAVLNHRGLDLLVMMVATLRAGGAYLPLDPKHPAKRMANVLSSSRPKLVLAAVELTPQVTDALALSDVVADTAVVSYQPDAIRNSRDNEALNSAANALGVNDLAYVIYTSGSTGLPKGAMVEHLGMLNNVYAKIPLLDLTPADVIAQTASQCFDISVWQCLTGLICGARVQVYPDDIAHDPEGLLAAVEADGVSILESVPSLIQSFLDLAPTLTALRWLMPTGEALTPELAQQWLRQYPKVPMMNAYGPAECADDVAMWPLHSEADAQVTTMPIGRPTDNNRLYVLNPQQQLQPIGVAGELYVAGAGVGRGYLNDATRTQQAFLNNVLLQHPAHHPEDLTDLAQPQRLYRTGDMVRWRQDGVLEYLGRQDHQVKIRGFRIELGEIEAVLLQAPEVKEAVVIARDNGAGQPVLAAYITTGNLPLNHKAASQAEAGMSAALNESLAQHVQAALPQYMVPSAFTLLDKLPLTPNGKVDRKALSAMALTLPKPTFVAPSNKIEAHLCKIFQELLNLEQVGTRDSFLALGGHSLLIVRLKSAIEKQLKRDIPLAELMANPTVEAIALQVASSNQRGIRIGQAPAGASVPLSFAQQRLWFLDQLEGRSSLYNIPSVVEITGNLDPLRLQDCFATLVERHTSLRTRFVNRDGEGVQEVFAAEYFRVNRVNLRGEAAAVDTLAQAHVEAFVGQAPALDQPGLFAVTLLQLEQKRHWLMVNCHHMIADGWSLNLLLQEFIQLYQGAGQPDSTALPTLAIQYGDYAYWQQADEQRLYQQQMDYWLKQLHNPPALMALPTDYPRPSQQSYRGDKHGFALSPDLSQQVKRAAQAQGCTQFMLLLAAWQVFLARYSGQGDILVGTPVANRHFQDTQDLVGFFANTIVLRGDLTANPSFNAFLQQVKRTSLDAQRYQDAPFEQLVDQLNVPRDTAYSPLFQVMFAWSEGNEQRLESTLGSDLALRHLGAVTTGTAKFDLDLALHEHNGVIAGRLEYATDLFKASTIAQMARQFSHLLEGLLAQPDVPVNAVALLDSGDCQQMLQAFNGTQADFPEHQCIHQGFVQQVKRTPDAIALQCGDVQLSYQDLDKQSNQLARYLMQALAIQPDQRVGVYLQRSVEMMVSILAILKAGGAYVPLDPSFPQERIAYMCQDAELSGVVTTGEFARACDGLQVNTCPLLLLDSAEFQGQLASYSSDVLPEDPKRHAPEHLAYVIYTSGSTGRPKGVMVERRGVRNLLHWYQQRYQINHRDVCLVASAMGFDLTQKNLFAPLLCGAKLVLQSPGIFDPQAIAQTIENTGATFTNCAPSLFYPVVNAAATCGVAGEYVPLRSLRMVLFGGEPINDHVLTPWLNHPETQVDIVNMYGPTECTDIVTEMNQHQRIQANQLGTTIANVATYVLNPALQLQPVGVMGELYVSGVGVARGYLNDPEMTDSKFVANPYYRDGMPVHYQRMYKTGDQVIRNSDGSMSFVGRVDHQIKMRGYRIDLAEVEHCLRGLRDVEDALVSVFGEAEQAQLLAHVAMGSLDASGIPETQQRLRHALQQQLPNYMVPAHILLMPDFPLTANGKVDRKALPKPQTQQRDDQAPLQLPSTALEQQLADIWARELGLVSVGVDQDFFALGGHSLLAIKVVAAMEKIHSEIKLPLLFQKSTIQEIAHWCENHQFSGQTISSTVETDPDNIPPKDLQLVHPLRVTAEAEGSLSLFCIHHGGGHTLQYQTLANALDQRIPVYGIQARGFVDPEFVETSIQAMAEDYVSQLRQCQPEGPYRLLGWSVGGSIAMAMTQVLESQGQEVAFLGLVDATIQSQTTHKHNVLQHFLPMLPQDLQDAYQAVSTQERERLEQQLDHLDDEQGIQLLLQWCVQRQLVALTRLQHLALTGKTLVRYQRLAQRHRFAAIRAPLQLFWAQDTLDKQGSCRTQWWPYCEAKIERGIYSCGHYEVLDDIDMFKDLEACLI